MKLRALPAALFLFGTFVLAASLPELRTEPMEGGSTFHIRNTAGVPLTGYLIELVDYPGSSFTMIQDELLTGNPIAPGADRTLSVNSMTPGAVPEYVKLTAALFADGSSAGDPAKVARLQTRREFLRETARELARRLREGKTQPDLAPSLKSWAEASFPPPTKSNRNSQAAINNVAAHGLVMDAANRLARQSPDDVLSHTEEIAARLQASSR